MPPEESSAPENGLEARAKNLSRGNSSDDESSDDGAHEGTGDEGNDSDDTRRRKAPLWMEVIILFGVALVMALIIKTFFVQAFYIPSGSMEPGLVKDDRILVQKVSYWAGEPERGEVVVFEDPGDWLIGPVTGPETWLAKGLARVGLYPTGGHLVKRVIGLPGDTIVCCDEDGKLKVNGVSIDADDFIRPQPDCDGPMYNGCQGRWKVTVPEDRVFVMGDNRRGSADSSDRLCAPGEGRGCDEADAFVPIDKIVGKVFVLFWPAGHADWIGTPDAFDDVPDPS